MQEYTTHKGYFLSSKAYDTVGEIKYLFGLTRK